MDGRRLVPLRRIPPDRISTYFTGRPLSGRRAADRPAKAYDDYDNLSSRGIGGRFREAQRAWISCRGGARLPSILRTMRSGKAQALDRLVAAQPLEGADDVDSGALGPGGYVGRDPLLPGAEPKDRPINITIW